jgi:hypothetical protein
MIGEGSHTAVDHEEDRVAQGEIRCQEREMQMLPNADSAFWLVGALLAEPHKVWGIGKRDCDLVECCERKIP